MSLLRASTSLLALTSLACVAPTPDSTPPSDAGSPAVEAQGPSPRGEISLHPIAAREGNLELGSADGRAFLLIDAEPVPLQPGVAPQRQPAFARGLEPFGYALGREITSFGGSFDAGPGFLVVREDFDRAGSSFDTLVWGREGWTPRKLGHGNLQGYYQAIVRLPDDALLGLRGYEFATGELPEIAYDDSPEATAWWQAYERERNEAPAGFEVLAGTPAAVPALPQGWLVADAAATTSGHIVALAYQPVPGDAMATGLVHVLEWAPGETQAQVRALPQLDQGVAYLSRIWPAGDAVLVSSWAGEPGSPDSRPYLAVGDESGWTPIPVDLPGLEGSDQTITSATRTDDGELWITVGGYYYDFSAEPMASLWRLRDGAWTPVALPAPSEPPWDTRARWIHDIENRWIEIPADAAPAPFNPVATRVRWADGVLWVVAKVGRVYPSSDEIWSPDARSIAYASRSVDAPVLLPSYDTIHAERVDAVAQRRAGTPGSSDCHQFTIVLADRPSADRKAALVGQLEALPAMPQIDEATTVAFYLGTPLDDPAHPQMVLDGLAWTTDNGQKLVAGVERILGQKVTTDCRPRAAVEMYRQD